MTRGQRLVAWLRTARGIGAAIAALLTLAVGFLPLFAGPGYEQSVACGLMLPTLVALVASAEGFADRHAVAARTPLQIVLRGLGTAGVVCGVAAATALLHGLRVGMCDLFGGLATFALTAVAGTLLAGVVGAAWAIAVGHLFEVRRRRRRIAMWLAGLTPLATALVAVGYFFFTPAVFAFDPFAGFFSGTLYDEVVDAFTPLLTYRAGTLATLLAVTCAAASLDRFDSGRASLANRRVGALAAFFALISATFVFYGTDLGHRSTAGSIRVALGATRSGARCDVVYPRGTPDYESELLVRDCEEELAAVETRLGVQGPPRVTAYFFKDAEQKRALMGAAETYVAKPWRREVYLQLAAYPHPVLGHELAHVVAGGAARGPLKIAGGLGGLLPNPGLVEGVAVYASPDRDELTPSQWAAAMKRLDILPPLGRTFGGGFLAQNSSIAYTVAGAFIGWAYQTGQGAAVRAWYGGARFEHAFGKSFGDAEAAFRASLDAVPLPPEALLVAKGRFDRPAIWGRRCPHVVEKLRDEAEQCRDEGDYATAEARYLELLSLDTVDPSARLDRAKVAGLRGDEPTMRALLEALSHDTRVASNWRARAHEALGDDDLRHVRLDAARAQYDAARAEVLDDDWSRNLDVKSFLTSSSLRARLFGRLLVGKGKGRESKDDVMVATIDLARFLGAREVGVQDPAATDEDVALSRYLIGRRMVDAHAWDEADAVLGSVDVAVLGRVTPRLWRETERLRLQIACMADASVRKTKVDDALTRFLAAPPGNAGRRDTVERFAARCATAR